MLKKGDVNIPRHVAIIMDGNRRWAAERGLPAFAGHKKVVEDVVEKLIERAGELGIEYITFWAWSSENWKRPEKEVGGIMKLFRWALGKKAREMIKKGARLNVIGDINAFPEDIQKGIAQMIEESAGNIGITVTYALNYGGRSELIRVINSLIQNSKLKTQNNNSKFKIEVTKEDIENFLDTAGMPDPDLIIRPGGTKRLSGFMLWQSEYSELYFTDTLMPDFDESEFEKALVDFSTRERRFGGGGFEGYKKNA